MSNMSSVSVNSSYIPSPSSTALSPAETNATSTSGLPFLDFGGGYSNVPGTASYTAQNQSGLETQLLVCASVGLLCFLVFCFLRTRWTVIFAPRLNMKRHKPPELPNTFLGWVIPLIKINQQELADKVGLDAVVMLQFIAMGIKLFALCSFFGVVALVPISLTTGETAENNVTRTIDRLSITVLEDSSEYLIAYLAFTYFFCLTTFFFLYSNYLSFIFMRAQYLLRMSKTLSCRSVIVTGVPRPLRSDEALAEYYEHLGIGPVENTHIVRHVQHLNSLLKKRALALRRLEAAYVRYWGNPCRIPDYDPDRILDDAHLFQRVEQQQREMMSKEEERQFSTTFFLGLADGARFQGRKSYRPTVRTGFLGLFGKKVDAIEYYTQIFEDLDRQVQEARKSSCYEMTNVGFVTFRNMSSALIASQIAIHPEPFNCRTNMAYEPRDVLWTNVTIRGRERLIREFLVWTVTILLSFFWIGPIASFSALTSVDTLRRVFPKLVDAAESSPFLQNIIQGLLPTLAVNIFMAILPLIFDALGVVQGLRSRSAIAEATFSKYFFFLLFNVLLVFTIASTVTKTVEELLNHPTEVANLLGTTLPAVAPFFINYTILQGMLLMPLSLLLFGALIIRGFTHVFLCKTPRDYAENRAPWSFNYGTGYPPPLLIFIIVLEYSTISPIILLFGTVYFCITYLVYKYQFLYVYFKPYDAMGSAWTMVFPRIIVGMLIFQLTMAGLFLLKKYITLGILCIPLMVLTILFKITMDAAFAKNSKNLPMQLLRDQMTKLPTHSGRSQQLDSEDDDDDDDDDGGDDKDEEEEKGTGSAKLDNLEQVESVSREPAKSRWKLATAFASQISRMQHSKSPFHSLDQSRAPPPSKHRRVILDEDDYEAIPDRRTDYRQPPMTLNPGILDTGLKRYGNPALVGVLPQLWLPVKCPTDGAPQQRVDASKRISNLRDGRQIASELARLLRRAESARRRAAGVLDQQHQKDGVVTVATGSSVPPAPEQSPRASTTLRRILGGSPDLRLSRTSFSTNQKAASISQEHILNDPVHEEEAVTVDDRSSGEQIHLQPLDHSDNFGIGNSTQLHKSSTHP